VYAILKLVVNTFSKAHPYIQHCCKFQQLWNYINNNNDSVELFVKFLCYHLEHFRFPEIKDMLTDWRAGSVVSLRCPSCIAHAPYCRLRSIRLCIIFAHYPRNRKISGKKLLNVKCSLILFTNFVWNIPHSKKNWAIYDKICVLAFM